MAMTRKEAKTVLAMLNAIWARADDTRENMTEEEARISFIAPDMLRAAGFPVCANHDGILIFADGME